MILVVYETQIIRSTVIIFVIYLHLITLSLSKVIMTNHISHTKA